LPSFRYFMISKIRQLGPYSQALLLPFGLPGGELLPSMFVDL